MLLLFTFNFIVFLCVFCFVFFYEINLKNRAYFFTSQQLRTLLIIRIILTLDDIYILS